MVYLWLQLRVQCAGIREEVVIPRTTDKGSATERASLWKEGWVNKGREKKSQGTLASGPQDKNKNKEVCGGRQHQYIVIFSALIVCVCVQSHTQDSVHFKKGLYH